MYSVYDNKDIMIEAWTETLQDMGWVVEIKHNSNVEPDSPDIEASSNNQKMFGFVLSKYEQERFRKIIQNISNLKTDDNIQIHILLPKGHIRDINPIFREFPGTRSKIDSIWELI